MLIPEANMLIVSDLRELRRALKQKEELELHQKDKCCTYLMRENEYDSRAAWEWSDVFIFYRDQMGEDTGVRMVSRRIIAFA